jgi:hypothetical protein
MFGSAILFLNWHLPCTEASETSEMINNEGENEMKLKSIYLIF